MAEFNPYKLEEEKWTPNNVYEILPPNAVSWSDYEFGQGTDNVNQEAANKSLIDGFVDFFKELFGTAGKILAGAVEVGGVILGGFVKGVAGLIGGIAKAIGSIFRGSGESPNLPLFNPIKTNLEAAIQPQRDKINESLQRTEEILAEQLVLRGQMDESLQDMRDARDRANEAIEKSGQSIAEAQAASDAAEAARQTLEEYNTALNKRITTEFNSAVGRANTAVEKADTLAGELSDFKAQQQAAINEAISKAEQAVADLSALSPKVEDAVAESSVANRKVADLTPQVSDAVTKAGAASAKAIKALSKPEIGESLIEYLTPTDAEVQAGTARYDIPVWSTAAPKSLSVNHEISQKLPEGYRTEVYYASSTDGTGTARKSGVKVRPGTKYIWSFWARGSGKIVIYMYGNGNGSPVRMTRQIKVNQETYQAEYDSEGRRLYDPAANGNSSNTNGTQWLLNGFKPDKLYDWTHYKFEVEFTESTTEVWFQNFYWNWGEVSTYGQYLANMQFYPDVPTQGQVDAAQNKAIEALNLFASKQDEWNKGTKAALDVQKTVNDNFKKWTEGAEKAIQANTDVAVALARINGIQVGGRNLLKKSNLNISNSSYPTARVDFGDSVPRDGEEITISVKGSLGTGKESIAFYNSGGLTFIAQVLASEKDPNGVYKVVTKWRANSDNTHVNIYASPNTVTATSKIEWVKLERGNQASDWTPAPEDLPTQAAVDKAQNDAIEANTEALKALGKKVLGASLVPYKTPSTQEVQDYAAGKLNYDPWADPEYLNAGHSIVSPARGRVARANANQRTKNFTGSYVTVDSNIGYKVKFHTYASTSGSNLYIYMRDQNGELALAETPFTNTSVTSGGLVHNLTLPAGIKEWSGVIKFKPGTTQVRLDTFYWNHPNGSTTGTQEFGGLEIVPDIPDANVVNELQEHSIRKNEKIGIANKQAIEALRDGLNASIELGEVNQIVGNLRDELEEEAKKREALQEKIDALQNEMIPRTIVSDDRVTYDDYVELSGNRVTAKGSWAGQLAVTYEVSTGSGDGRVSKTLVTRKSVPDGMTREWKIWDSIQRVDYWVYQGRQRTILLKNTGAYITGSSFSKGTWSVLATHKVGKTYGTGKIEWRANLLYADRNATYRFAIEVNGTTVKNVSWQNQGPLTPLGNGERTLKFEHEFDLPDDATVRILGYISGGGSQQAKVTLLQGTLVYVQDTTREAQ